MRHGEYDRRGLTARKHWGRYAVGILTEAAFVLGLTVLAYLMALVAMAVYR